MISRQRLLGVMVAMALTFVWNQKLLPSRAILELFRAWMPSASPTSAMMTAALIFLIFVPMAR